MVSPMWRPAIAIATLALGACLAAAATTPWMLGDETTTACYTLDTLEDIPLPAGLDMQWVLPLPGALDSSAPYLAEYAVTVDDAVFWSDAGNVARLGADHARWRQLCNASATANNTGCSDANKAACCVYHSNLHSCRQSTGSACEPWVTPRNATATDAPAACGSNATTDAPVATAAAASEPTVLVTHTAAQVGAVGPYVQRLQLPAGSWVTIAHVKIMNFQCAVGALRRAVEPEHTTEASSAAVVGLAVGLSAGAILLVAAVAAWRASRSAGNVRDVSNAPRGEAGTTTTILFTDIQDSTQLWGNYTAATAMALDAHHRVIRGAIATHGGYEVKTVGDAFMIACKSAGTGVAIARDIQLGLQAEAWPVCIGEHYEANHLEDAPETLTTPEDARTRAFNGPRVRIGVHTGTPDVQFDEVAKGYDYYGPDVNTAARVESSATGGQILVSPGTLAAVREELGALGLTIGHANQVALKGIDGEVTLTSLEADGLPVPRDLPVINKGASLIDDDAVDDFAMSMSGAVDMSGSVNSNHSVMSHAAHGGQREAAAVRKIHRMLASGPAATTGLSETTQLVDTRRHWLETLLKPLKPKEQEAVLGSLCGAWRTPVTNVSKAKRTDVLTELLTRFVPVELASSQPSMVLNTTASGSFQASPSLIPTRTPKSSSTAETRSGAYAALPGAHESETSA